MKHTTRNGMIFINGVKKGKTYQELKDEFEKFDKDYRKNPLPPGKEYNKYVRKWKKLNSEIRYYYSASNLIKRAGMKVKKTRYGYEFYGNSGLVAEVYEDACEGVYWTVCFVKGTEKQEWDLSVNMDTTFETKNEALRFLYAYDSGEYD